MRTKFEAIRQFPAKSCIYQKNETSPLEVICETDYPVGAILLLRSYNQVTVLLREYDIALGAWLYTCSDGTSGYCLSRNAIFGEIIDMEGLVIE